MQMVYHGGPALELHQPEARVQPLAKEKIVAVMEHRVREQLAFLRLRLPVEADGQALLAGLARRILHGAAVAALLQLEAPERGSRRKAERDTAACRGRQRRQPRTQDRVLALLPF